MPRQLLRRASRILRRVQTEMTSALRQLVEGGVIQLTLRHRRKDRCRLANRPAGTFHPAVADFNTVKHARAHGQGLRGFLPRTLYRQLPVLHFHHRDAFPALQACVRYLPEHRQTFPLGHRQCLCPEQRPLAVDRGNLQIQTAPFPVFQGQHIAARGHPVNDKAIVRPGLRIPAFHHHPLPVIIPHAPAFAVQPHRRQGCNGRVFLTQHPLLSEGVTDKAVEYALFTRPADLGHAFLSFTHADGKLLCQPAVACSFIRFTDDVGCGLMAPLPAIRIHAAVLQHRQRTAGPAALPAVGEQDLHVMAHRAIEQGNRFLQAQLLRLIHDECSARNKRRPVLQGGFTGHRFPGQTHITGEKIT